MKKKTSRQYKQQWMIFKHKNPKLNRNLIWDFQKSILDDEEQLASASFRLYLKSSDPRSHILKVTDELWQKSSYR